MGEKELPRYGKVSNFDGREQRNVPFLGGAMEGRIDGWIHKDKEWIGINSVN